MNKKDKKFYRVFYVINSKVETDNIDETIKDHKLQIEKVMFKTNIEKWVIDDVRVGEITKEEYDTRISQELFESFLNQHNIPKENAIHIKIDDKQEKK